jgi:hypothetical protein
MNQVKTVQYTQQIFLVILETFQILVLSRQPKP